MLPKLVITDIDGVWTDGGMYYDESGNEFKKFNTSDSAGVLFCKILGIPTCIMTGENVQSVKRRSEKLKIDHLFLGAANKLALATQLCVDLGINLNEVAFIGDDINDIQLLKAVGFSCSVANAPAYVKNVCNYVTKREGGSGAFREFVEYILVEENALNDVLEKYLSGIHFEQ